jgi:hypothetical protein
MHVFIMVIAFVQYDEWIKIVVAFFFIKDYVILVGY